jgi:hypothetical protein
MSGISEAWDTLNKCWNWIVVKCGALCTDVGSQAKTLSWKLFFAAESEPKVHSNVDISGLGQDKLLVWSAYRDKNRKIRSV